MSPLTQIALLFVGGVLGAAGLSLVVFALAIPFIFRRTASNLRGAVWFGLAGLLSLWCYNFGFPDLSRLAAWHDDFFNTSWYLGVILGFGCVASVANRLIDRNIATGQLAEVHED